MDISRSFFTYKPAAHFLVTDEDAADFLQSQFTNDLRPFEPGQSTYGLWLDVKGKVVADSVVLCEGAERFRVLSERCRGEAIVAHLERHIIADDVVIEQLAPGFGLELSAEALEILGLQRPDQGRFIRIEGGILHCVRPRVYNMVLDSESEANPIQTQLTAAGFSQMSEAQRGLVRIAAGRPQVPDEIGETDMPGEGGLERVAISFTKGCYLGQEVVARMHNVGKPQRGLFVVKGLGAVPELPQALHNSEGKQVGELRTAYPEEEGWHGVAILKTRFAGEGETLQLEANQIWVIRPLGGVFQND